MGDAITTSGILIVLQKYLINRQIFVSAVLPEFLFSSVQFLKSYARKQHVAFFLDTMYFAVFYRKML